MSRPIFPRENLDAAMRCTFSKVFESLFKVRTPNWRAVHTRVSEVLDSYNKVLKTTQDL